RRDPAAADLTDPGRDPAGRRTQCGRRVRRTTPKDGAAMGSVAIVATLDTKGREVAYLRDRLQQLGIDTLVIDSGILGEPVGIEPDVSRSELAERGGTTLAA